MKSRIIIFIVALLICGSAVGGVFIYKHFHNETENNVVEENIVSNNVTEFKAKKNSVVNNTDFVIDFLKLENDKKDMVYSPLSIKTAFKMLDEGADKETKAQIEKVIGTDDVNYYEDIQDVISFANAIYIKDLYKDKVKQSYTDVLKEKYNSELKYDDFSSPKNINKWIKEKTFGRLENVVTKQHIEDAKLVLINALAIDTEWKSQFEKNETSAEDFYIDNDKTVECAMMSNSFSNTNNAKYYSNSTLQAFSMDIKKYGDNELEFIAIMPTELDQYIKTLSIDKLNQLVDEDMKTVKDLGSEVKLKIPRFKFDRELSLKKDLQKLGMVDAFEDTADFSKIVEANNIKVSDAIHKAEIEFSEEGIKASAATVIYMTEKAVAMESKSPKTITFDHPFMYLIRDKNTKEIWFVGSVYNPLEWNEVKSDYKYEY